MATRRSFLKGLLAAGLVPGTSWADAGNPAYLAAARLPSGAYALFGLGEDGTARFQVPLPGRGHAAAAHPKRPVAVTFARRPGRFALVLDCLTGRVLQRLTPPPGQHFYGHGVFSADGALLFTTENEFENARGMIGIWDARAQYRRIGSVSSGGTGPHDLRLMPDGQSLVVANGGIETHPDSGRAKLNLPHMQPNLSYVSLDGDLLERHAPPPEWHKASIRHLALHPDGTVAIACQWEGDVNTPSPLLATHKRGQGVMFQRIGEGVERAMRGYAGSVAFSGNGADIALTGPRGGLAVVTDIHGTLRYQTNEPDICGVAPRAHGFLFTTGLGRILKSDGETTRQIASHACNWDNHLVAIT